MHGSGGLVVSHQERSESLTLNSASPGQARSIVSAVVADWRLEPDVAERAELLVSEIVADAVDHGSDAATLRITLDDDKLELELFDGPRRSAIARSGREEGVPGMRMRVLAKVADGRYSSDLGESHYARYEIRWS
jgi:anti-sigma regulatory factor (Ser/Thr protein kinase)